LKAAALATTELDLSGDDILQIGNDTEWLVATFFTVFLVLLYWGLIGRLAPVMTLAILEQYNDSGMLREQCRTIWQNAAIVSALFSGLLMYTIGMSAMHEIATGGDGLLRFIAILGVNSGVIGMVMSVNNTVLAMIHMTYTSTLDEVGMARYLVSLPVSVGFSLLSILNQALLLFLLVASWAFVTLGKVSVVPIFFMVSIYLLLFRTFGYATVFSPKVEPKEEISIIERILGPNDWRWIEKSGDEQMGEMLARGNSFLRYASAGTLQALSDFYEACKAHSEHVQLHQKTRRARRKSDYSALSLESLAELADHQRLSELLERLDMAGYIDRFHEHQLSYSVLEKARATPVLFNDAVTSAGVHIAGQRLRLFQAFAEEDAPDEKTSE
jgi:hypothetical protein